MRGPLWHFLADRFRLVRYDGRGLGLSDRDVADVSFAAFACDLATVVDALKLRRYALLGISQGAATAIAHAARYPERVSKMILLGAYARGRYRRISEKESELGKAFLTLMREGWGTRTRHCSGFSALHIFPAPRLSRSSGSRTSSVFRRRLKRRSGCGAPSMKSISPIYCRTYQPQASSYTLAATMSYPLTRDATLPLRFRMPNSLAWKRRIIFRYRASRRGRHF